MPAFRLRIREEVTTQSCCDFSITADTPQAAAAVLQAAYRDALSRGSPLICLADGQVGMLDPEPRPSRVVTYHLLDDADAIVASVTPPNGLHG